jgi:acyl-CoA reductase-like NAD-dependent aldehyde dehydrogenase
LIVPANTPIANVAWKAFPALVCGNTVVLKSAEDTPGTAALFASMVAEAGLPRGVFNVVHGFGREAGAALVEHPAVGVISFTGSTAVGREIQRVAGARLARVSLELGGKNPFVVCDDADLDQAVHWAVLSAFSNAGQRCASGSRIIVFATVAKEFTTRLVESTKRLRVGSADDDDFGPVINERQMKAILQAIERARADGARVLTGGRRAGGPLAGGFYIEPTLVEGIDSSHEMSHTELFGPVATLYVVDTFDEALACANSSPYGLTACIHTRSLDRAMTFVDRVDAGVAVVNAGTFGSEPHMPFGGVKASGNGSREPGTEALDVYSNIKDVYLNVDERRV